MAELYLTPKATEAALKERIKELTCLYEVSSVIANADAKQLYQSLIAIGKSLKKAFQFPKHTHILIHIPQHTICTGDENNTLGLKAKVKVFNKSVGYIIATLTTNKSSFLKEEKLLLDNVGLKIGNLLERLEIQQSETSLKRQMERADRLAILGEITAGIAHELNTPLANILGFAELLKEDYYTHADIADDLDKIIKNAIFSREVVKKLLFFSCEMPQQMQKVNIIPSIKSAVNLLEASFKKAQVNYKLQLDENALFIKADTIQFTQIIFNLVINAIYFSPKHSTVTIKAWQTKHHVLLTITDEGKGLSNTSSQKIFQPFFTTKPTGDGSGLGLSVVHGIVKSHKGTITAVNNTTKGATFKVTLPKT